MVGRECILCVIEHYPFILVVWLSLLYDRGYTGQKLKENIECEIFQTILEEARSSYKLEIVHELHSNQPEDIDNNTDIICTWIDEWRSHTQEQT